MRRVRGRLRWRRACASGIRRWEEHYLTVARVTKAARHFSEGVQLFRGLGDAQTAAWLRGRLAFAQATVAARDGGPSPRKHLKARAAVGSLVEALQAFADTVSDEDTGASPSFPGVATISAKHALAEAKRGAARASLALAVMAPPQDAPAALRTAAELAADADDSETAADAHYRLASGGSGDALMHLQQATAFADRAATESQSRARAVDALSTRCDLATVLLRIRNPEAAAKAVQAVLAPRRRSRRSVAARVRRQRPARRPAPCLSSRGPYSRSSPSP